MEEILKVTSKEVYECRRCFTRVPNAVEYVAVGIDPDVEVGLDDVVELAGFFVPEKSVRHPDLHTRGKVIEEGRAANKSPH